MIARLLTPLLPLAIAAAPIPSAPRPGPQQGAVLTWNEAGSSVSASCARVWGVLLDRALWQGSFLSRESLSGSFGRAGEVALVHSKYGAAGDRFERMLVSDRSRRMVIGFTAPNSGVTGFVEFRLATRSNLCNFTMNVMLSLPALSGQDEEAFRTAALASNQILVADNVRLIAAAAKSRR